MVPDEILDDEAIETTMKSITEEETKFENEDEIETTMMPMIDDDMVSTYTLHKPIHSIQTRQKDLSQLWYI